MKKFIVLLLFLCLSSAAYAENNYLFSINVSKASNGYNSKLLKISVIPYSPNTYSSGDTVKISLKDGNKVLSSSGFFVQFINHIDKVNENGSMEGATIISDSLTVSLKMSYLLDANYVDITTSTGTNSYKISDFICNKNAKCDNGENHVTCPEECTEGSDGKCVPVIDNFCDPDCEEGRDPDCAKEPVSKPTINESYQNATNEVPANPKSEIEKTPAAKINKAYIYALGILILLLLILFIAKKFRKPESETQFSDEPKP